MGSYDDGIYIYFDDKKPQHITFSMWTDDPEIETCDFRLTSIDKNASFPNSSSTSNYSANANATATNTTNKTSATNTTVKTNTTTATNKTNTTTVVIPQGPYVQNFTKI